MIIEKKNDTLDLKLDSVNWTTGDVGPYSAFAVAIKCRTIKKSGKTEARSIVFFFFLRRFCGENYGVLMVRVNTEE